jgi:hypothetical protein
MYELPTIDVPWHDFFRWDVGEEVLLVLSRVEISRVESVQSLSSVFYCPTILTMAQTSALSIRNRVEAAAMSYLAMIDFRPYVLAEY